MMMPARPAPAALPRSASASYWQLSRAPRYSVTLALPLFLLYEGLAAALSGPNGGGIRNGADVILKTLVTSVVGPRGPLVFLALVMVAGIWFVARDLRRHPGRLRHVFVRRLKEALPGEHLQRALQDLLASLIEILLLALRHREPASLIG